MKRILITHAFGPQNRGDHELLQKLIDIVRLKYGARVDITVFTTYPSESRLAFEGVTFFRSPFFRPTSISELFYSCWDLVFWGAASYATVFHRFLTGRRKKCFKEVLGADVIYMCPGGYMYSNGLSFFVNIINGVVFRQSQAIKIAAPMSIGPFFSKFEYASARFFFKNIDVIHLRESFSFELVRKMGFDPVFTHDLAWWDGDGESAHVEDASWCGSFVGTVIDWSYPGMDSVDGFKERYIVEYLKAADALYEGNFGKPLILYTQVGAGDGTSKDEKLIAEIVERSKGKVVFDGTACTPLILKSRMKYCRGVLASRFHSALFAIQAEASFVAIAYQPKAEYILKDMGLSDLCRDIKSFIGEEVASILLKNSIDAEKLKKRLVESSDIAQKNILQSFVENM